MSATGITLGIDTFGDVTADELGRAVSQAQVIRDVVEEGVLAEQVGLDHFGVGEHHRDDFAVSAPEVVLAAVAARTSTLRIGSSVTVLSSDDPVRVYQRFATLDAVSGGRAEMIVGRGSFTESFPLFGLDLRDYEQLFEEKLDLLAALRTEQPVTWSGSVRAPLDGVQVHPTTGSGRLPVWVGVGGSPESVVRAARHGMPMMLAIIGGRATRFRPYVQLYHQARTELGAPTLPVGVHSGGFVAATDAQARQEHYAVYKKGIDRIGRERGWPPLTPERYAADVDHGSLYVGSPETVARKIASTVDTLGVQRFDLKYSAGELSHAALMRSIELYGTQVAPRVRELLRSDAPAAALAGVRRPPHGRRRLRLVRVDAQGHDTLGPVSPDPLTAQEEAAWRALVRLMVVLPRAIDDDLSHRAGMGLTTYVALMNLSESPGHELRMRDLAERSALSPSRMTRVVDALERDGLVVRGPSTEDQRTTLARLTGAGLDRLQQAWPAHLAGARALVMDHLGDQELSQFTGVVQRLIAVVERAAGERP